MILNSDSFKTKKCFCKLFDLLLNLGEICDEFFVGVFERLVGSLQRFVGLVNSLDVLQHAVLIVL